MQEDLHAKVARLENLIAIQKNCTTNGYTAYSDYMGGIYNGLVMAHCMFIPATPKFISPPVAKKNRLRYKGKRRH